MHAIRLLTLTGARKSEILGLRWEWVDFEGRRINLPDSKTGEKSIPAECTGARSTRPGFPRVDGNPHVIVGGKQGAALVNLKDPWNAIRTAAGLEDVRVHDLRHSFAAVGAGGGQSLPIIGAPAGTYPGGQRHNATRTSRTIHSGQRRMPSAGASQPRWARVQA